jgi:hypothetical protein
MVQAGKVAVDSTPEQPAMSRIGSARYAQSKKQAGR